MRTLPALALLLCLGACASPDRGDYPSLAPRPVESRSDAVTTPPERPAPPAGAELRAQIAELRTQLTAEARRFDQAFPAAERAIRAGARAAVGSDAWVEAQSSLSDLTVAQAATTAVLTRIDDLLATRVTGSDPSGTVEIATLRQEAEMIAEAQRTRLAPLSALLSA